VKIEEFFGKTLDFLRQRKRAYQLCFSSPAGNVVLQDLVKFCRAAETCVVPNDRDRTLLLEGRREVILRINQHLHLNSQQLFDLFNGKNILTENKDE